MKTVGTDVVITGVGPVTSIGVGAEALWAALLQGRQSVAPRGVPVDIARVEPIAIASMPDASAVLGLAPHVRFLAEQDCPGYRDLTYALLATELALADAGLTYDRSSNSIGAIQAFEAPGVEDTVGRVFGMFSTPPPTDRPPALYDALAGHFYNMQPFLYVHLVGKAFGFHGFSTSVHNACTSGAYAIELAAERIRRGDAEAMIVLGGEAFETGVRLEWFRRLDLYAKDGCMKPFDAAPSGFFVGEGAAAMVLESAESAARRGAQPYARYLGGSFAHQSWKQVIPDVRASKLAEVITRSMAVAGVSPEQIDLIVPHGAATQLSDGYESACLATALHGRRDHAVATAFKPYFGHMLAASGLIDTVATVLSLKHQTVPATLHTSPENVRLPVPLATAVLRRPIRTVLKLCTGFTGHDAAMVFGAA